MCPAPLCCCGLLLSTTQAEACTLYTCEHGEIIICESYPVKFSSSVKSLAKTSDFLKLATIERSEWRLFQAEEALDRRKEAGIFGFNSARVLVAGGQALTSLGDYVAE